MAGSTPPLNPIVQGMKKSEALKILGLSSSYTEDDIKKAHRQKIRENHPDQFSDPEKKAAAEEQTKLINEARDVLVNKRWDPEYGPRTGAGYNPYANPYGNPFGGYGNPYSYRPGAGPQGNPFGGSGQNPFQGGFPFDFVWTSWDGTGKSQGGAYNPFDFSSMFNRQPAKTAAQVLEEEKRSLKRTAGFIGAKVLAAGICLATEALPMGISIYVLLTLVFALYRETSGCSRFLAIAFLAFFAPLIVRFVPVVFAASLTPAALVAVGIAILYDIFVLRSCLMDYRKAKRNADEAKA